MYIRDSALFQKTIFAYDERGRIREEHIYKRDTLGDKTTMHYDDKKGLKISTFYPSATDSFIQSITQYDESGNETVMEVYKKNGQIAFKRISEYDKHGNQIAVNYSRNDTLSEKHTYEYNAEDLKIRETVYERDRSKNYKYIFHEYTFKYNYDAQNNWISRVSYETGKETEVVKRKIEYY